MIAWGGRYEGAWDKDMQHGRGTFTWANGDRCVRHGRGVPGVSRGGAHAQRAGAWCPGSIRQDMTDAQVFGGATDAGAGCGLWVVADVSIVDMSNNDVGKESAQKFMKQTGALQAATLYFAS